MKQYALYLLALLFVFGCNSPQYLAQKGNYDKAIEGYCAHLRNPKQHKKSGKDIDGLEWAFAKAQSQDSAALAALETPYLAENWPKINAIHRKIQARQKNVQSILPLQRHNGSAPHFSMLENMDSLQDHSRHQAAAYLYAHAQTLLALTDSSGQRQPAREAYFALRNLKTNYYPYWENTNTLIDSAYHTGKSHILFETSTENGVSDGNTFWESASLKPNFIKNEWLVFYNDATARPSFDYLAKCKLVSLYVGSESTSSTERTETKQVEDGYDETTDSSGHVVSRTVKYKTETKTITTYTSSRSAYGTIVLELVDLHAGKVLSTESISGTHNFEESSEMCAPSAPTYWGMIDRVVSNIEWDLRSHLKKVFP